MPGLFSASRRPDRRTITSAHGAARYRFSMMLLRALLLWTVQCLLFCIGIGVAGLIAHLAGPLLASAFAIDELIPTAILFFSVAGGLGWLVDRYWPGDWCNPLL